MRIQVGADVDMTVEHLRKNLRTLPEAHSLVRLLFDTVVRMKKRCDL
jgi:hypothetical protein